MSVDSLSVPLGNEGYLESLLQGRLGSRVRDLRIQCLPAGLVIQGRAATYHAKQLAQHAAMELVDLPILANDIEVY
jgi:hypothetical protein